MQLLAELVGGGGDGGGLILREPHVGWYEVSCTARSGRVARPPSQGIEGVAPGRPRGGLGILPSSEFRAVACNI